MTGEVTGRDTVLVVADHADTTADDVCAVLTERDVRFFRFDTAEFPGRLVLDTHLSGAAAPSALGTEAEWAGTLRRAPRPGEPAPSLGGLDEVDLDRVRSVYLRRPRPFEVPAHLSVPERWHAATECRYGLGGVLTSLPVPFLNHPSASADAAYKPRQLIELAECGLRVPPTLITNSGAAVRAFAAAHESLICKSLAAAVLHVGTTAHVLYTRPVTPADLDELGRTGSGVDWAAHMFQPFIASTYAVRLIVVGERLFAVRIDAHSSRARMDWRADYDSLSYQQITMPDNITDAVLAYMRRAGLNYGAWDFLGHADGSLTALECNPEGNYAWLEDVVPVPITATIAQFLTDPPPHAAHARPPRRDMMATGVPA